MTKLSNYRMFFYVFLLTTIPFYFLQGQGVAINEDGTLPDNAAVLDISSTTKGVLFPRMRKYERDQINNPPIGLVIFNVEDTTMEYFAGGNWKLFDGTDAPQWACGDSILDAEGNVYPTVLITNQCWMGKNLNLGTRITGGITQSTTPGNIEKYCMANLESNCDVYGGLYQWKQAVQYWTGQPTLPVQGICPDGWHIPDQTEWGDLYDALSTLYGGGSAGSLKEQGLDHWSSPNYGIGTNNLGGDPYDFTALPAGAMLSGGYYFTQYALIWLANQTDASTARNIVLKYNQGYLTHYDATNKVYGMTVRCIRD